MVITENGKKCMKIYAIFIQYESDFFFFSAAIKFIRAQQKN